MNSYINKYQSGVAALTVAVIILFASTIIVLFAGKVGVQDQRISGNDSRAKQAFSGAEAGLEFAAGRLLTGSVDYTTTVNYVNSLSEPFYDAQIAESGGGILISSQGYADSYQSISTASVRQSFGFYDVLGGGPDVPLMVAGNIPPQGSMTVVGNPNGAGTGVNVAVWTSEVVTSMGNAETCERGEWEANGTTSTSANGDFNICGDCDCDQTVDGKISFMGTVGSDVVQNDSDFPTDVFSYVFGFSKDQYLTVKQMSDEINDCGDLGPNSNGMYWYTPNTSGTDCSIGDDVGGATGDNCGKSSEELCVVVLIIDDEDLKITSNHSGYGIFFLFDNPDIDDGSPGQLNLGGGSAVYGALIGSHNVCVANNCVSGAFDLVYERSIFEDLANDTSNQLLSRVAGTWIDQ